MTWNDPLRSGKAKKVDKFVGVGVGVVVVVVVVLLLLPLISYL